MEWADCNVFVRGALDQMEGWIEQLDVEGAYNTRQRVNIDPITEGRCCALGRGSSAHQVIADIAAHGVKEWKDSSGYHQHSFAENGMYRLKQLFGDYLAVRLFESQVTEVHVRIAINIMMASLGMPISVRIGTAAAP